MTIFKGPHFVFGLVLTLSQCPCLADDTFRLAKFSVDVTIPLGHRCMGLLETKSKEIVDPLFAKGVVLLGADKPIVWVAVDWCEIRNGAYQQWQSAVADAVGTTSERVLLASLHQHDTPVVDNEAQTLLDGVGLKGELFDREFHNGCVARVARAAKGALADAKPVTHLGFGAARVNQVASNRRVEVDGKVYFGRGSSTGNDRRLKEAPDGQIDPMLRSLTFWNNETPIAVFYTYATHPMSYYGRGGVSADFVGLARKRRQADLPGAEQIYFSGCSGDVTAGKYNDGSPGMRPVLADRLYQAMREAFEHSTRKPLTTVQFRTTPIRLPYRDEPNYKRSMLTKNLGDASRSVRDRIYAAMSLSCLARAEKGAPIQVSAVDFGNAQMVLLPGESFVAYQLAAQKISPKFVFTAGYGECWPGYIPTEDSYKDGFTDQWLWVAPGCEPIMLGALKTTLNP